MKLEIIKSIEINKPLMEIYNTISDVNQWPNWSPWACLEPDAKINHSKDNASGFTTLSWEGKLIGSGDMTVTAKTATQIDYDLIFHRPFKSTSKAWFKFNEENGKTKVTWGMESNLPFFMFFFKNMMKAFISSDYARGLTRLKEYMETGTILCEMSDVKTIQQNTFFLVGKREISSIDNIGPSMNAIFDKCMKDIETKKIPVPDGFISYYHKFDMVKSNTDYTCGVFYYQRPDVSTDYQITEIKNHNNLNLTLKGTYTHLPTAWSKIWCHQRGNKISLNKKISFYELYLNSPKMVAAKDILTELRIPIK